MTRRVSLILIVTLLWALALWMHHVGSRAGLWDALPWPSPSDTPNEIE